VERQNKIVIIGGTACGPKAGARARRCDPKARITLIEQQKDLSTATCGLPYYVAGVIKSESSLVARRRDFFTNVMDMDVLTGTRALSIHPEAHEVEALNLDTNHALTLSYDKLVLASGSTPVVPDLRGIDLKGIFTLTKIQDANDVRNLLASRKPAKAVIIGAGLIGLEMTEAFVSQGLDVTVIEIMDRVLPALLDFETAAYVGKHLQSKGVHLLLGKRVIAFEGDKDGWVHKVLMDDTEIETGLALLALGARPDVKLARDAGLTIGITGGIAVNQYLQTSDSDIYAGGDCVENTNLVTGQKILAPLGSTANKHGRVIGTNVTNGSDSFPGVLGTSIVKIFDYNVGRVGLSESQARKAGYDVITSLVPGYEHATYYPNGKEILVKLVVDRMTSRILGGQVAGPGETAKRIDVLATALTFGASVEDVANLDLAYAPPYNSAFDPLHNAANVICNKQSGYAQTLSPMEVKNKLEGKEDFVLLDVRSSNEWKTCRIEETQAKLLPLSELRTRLNEISPHVEVITYCLTSIRAYQAQRILEGAGFSNVKFMDGSIAAWPYEVKGTRNSR